MNERKTPWWLIVGGGVLVGLLLVACLGLALWGLTWAWWPGGAGPTGYRSNGEQIYFTATSQRGTPITSDMGMGMMRGGMITCASCHAPDGRGGRVRMMMRVFESPDIRYQTLTSEEMEHEEGEEHPPYTDETIKRAIIQAVNPAGEPLDWPMPRWMMSDEDLNDLLEYLKSLQ